jgi:transcriptional accessory protein Tex/SPT6
MIFKRMIEKRKLRKQIRQEIERQGVLSVASRLDTVEAQREFIFKYYSGELEHENIQ